MTRLGIVEASRVSLKTDKPLPSALAVSTSIANYIQTAVVSTSIANCIRVASEGFKGQSITGRAVLMTNVLGRPVWVRHVSFR
jgi:hypothetical protein